MRTFCCCCCSRQYWWWPGTDSIAYDDEEQQEGTDHGGNHLYNSSDDESYRTDGSNYHQQLDALPDDDDGSIASSEDNIHQGDPGYYEDAWIHPDDLPPGVVNNTDELIFFVYALNWEEQQNYVVEGNLPMDNFWDPDSDCSLESELLIPVTNAA